MKVWGRSAPRPDGDLRRYYEPAVEAFAEAGVAVELSTAGWRKPVGEQYPARPFLEMVVDAGCPVALSSDAHVPDQLGFEYERALELLESRRRARARGLRAPAAEAGADRVRTGIGIDSHRFEEGRRLVLGGVEIPFERGLAGHSDADVLAHAIADALLGAAGLGDIGQLFPDTEEAWKDADSMELLRDVVARVRAAGHELVHVDATVMLERPKLAPHREAIHASLGAVLGSVNVKATTGEGMGFVGRGEGAAALAVATMRAAKVRRRCGPSACTTRARGRCGRSSRATPARSASTPAGRPSTRACTSATRGRSWSSRSSSASSSTRATA